MSQRKKILKFDSPMKIPLFRETLHLNSPPMALFLNTLQNISLMQLMKRVSGFYYPFIIVSLFRPVTQLPTHPFIIFDRKASKFAQIGCFSTISCEKYTQFWIWAPLGCLWWKPTNPLPKCCKKAPKKAGTYMYTMSRCKPNPHPHLTGLYGKSGPVRIN